MTGMSELVHRNWLKLDTARIFLFYFSCVGTLGLLPIICFYYPHIYYQISAVSCSAEDSQLVHVSLGEEELICEVEHYRQRSTGEHLFSIEVESIRFCASNRNKYTFYRVPDIPIQFKRFLVSNYGLRQEKDKLDEESNLIRHHYGFNIMKIPETSFLEILLRYLLSPFYLFQYFSVAIWFAEDYWTFAVVILLITFLAIYVTANETLSNLESLRNLAGKHEDVQRIKRSSNLEVESGNNVELIDDSRLLPGERILIRENMNIPCDAILISGKVVVDESMLTGESIPVGKVPINLAQLAGDENFILSHGTIFENYSHLQSEIEIAVSGKQIGGSKDDSLVNDFEIATKCSGSVLFGGTKVRATFGDECIAVVYRTGFRSAKGSLILSLLKPKNDFITFVSDALWILFIMVIFCTVLYFMSAVILYSKDSVSISVIIFWYFDALTCAVPSALIASLSIATTVSIARLKEQHIFVSDTTRVNYAGVINAVCFDKTGTLTDDALSYQGALLAQLSDTTGPSNLNTDDLEEYRAEEDELPSVFQEIMSTCHGLLLYGLQDGNYSTPIGDPLEMELLRASGWKLQASNIVQGRILAFPPSSFSSKVSSETSAFVIMKHFEFSPDRLRAASLVQCPTGAMKYFVKGSPETVLALCQPHSIPMSVHDKLLTLARKGLRVLAVAVREFAADVPWSEVSQFSQQRCEEHDLRFVGLIYLSNQLKDTTQKTIATLHTAKVHTVMITGDHVFTAIAVAEECGILTALPASSTVVTSPLILSTLESGTDSVDKTDRIFIVDYDLEQHRILIIDAITEREVNEFQLPQLVYLAAQTNLQEIHHDIYTIKQEQHAAMVSTVRPRVQLAATGRGIMAVRIIMPEVFASLIRYTKVFARAKPLEKKLIVSMLMACPEFDNLVAMSPDQHTTTTSVPRPSSSRSLLTQPGHADVDESTSLLHPAASSSSSSASAATPQPPMAATSTRSHSLSASLSDCWSLFMTANSTKRGQNNSLEEQEVLFSPMDVIFCGDGANDMIALRAATVGVSLCDAQTSVAAPITSQRASPFAVVEVMREGRCSLITAYVLILFNIMYATIQVFFANMGYFFGMQSSGWAYLVQDLFFGLVLGIVTSYTEPTRQLSMTMPPKRFLKFYLLFRLFANLFLFIGFQSMAMYIVTQQPFYTEEDTDTTFGDSYGYPTAIAQHMALGQIMIASVVSSIGHPFRKAWYTNMYHVGALVIQFGWLLFQIFGQSNWLLVHVLELKSFPTYFGFSILAILLVNLLACLGITEIGDYYLLQTTNRRWFEMVEVTDLLSPDLDRSKKKMDFL